MKTLKFKPDSYTINKPLSDNDYRHFKTIERRTKLKIDNIARLALLYLSLFLLSLVNDGLPLWSDFSIMSKILLSLSMVSFFFSYYLKVKLTSIDLFLKDLDLDEKRDLLALNLTEYNAVERYLNYFKLGELKRPFTRLDYKIVDNELKGALINSEKEHVDTRFQSFISGHQDNAVEAQ